MGFMGSYADEITITREEYESLKTKIESLETELAATCIEYNDQIHDLKSEIASLENQLEQERTWE